jgi:4-amino-4-deoxy-L-arabinose transferase-like glycosyltransferase
VPGFRRPSPLLLILGVALALRVAAAFVVDAHLSREPGRDFLIAGDASGYWELSRKIAAGEEFAVHDPPRRVMRMPGFPLLLVLSGGNLLAARLILALVGTAACWLVYRLGRELIDETTGLVAAAITAVSPTMVGFSVLILSETAFAATMTLSLLLMTWMSRTSNPGGPDHPSALRGRRLVIAFLTGAAVSLACYVRPSWLLFGPGFFVCWLLGRSRIRKNSGVREPDGRILMNSATAAVFFLGMAVVLTPWVVRNYRATDGRFVATTLWVGPSLYDGLNPEATGDSNMAFFERDRVLERMSEFEMDRHYRRKAWEFVKERPGRAAELAVLKLARYWSPWPNAEQFQRGWMILTATACSILIFVPAMAGFWLMRRQFLVLLITAGPVFYLAAVHAVFVGSIRYRLPAEYPLAVLAAVGWVAGCRFFRKSPMERCRMDEEDANLE